MVGPIEESGHERMFNTLKVSNTTNDSHVCPLCPDSDVYCPMCVTYCYFCKTSVDLQ